MSMDTLNAVNAYRNQLKMMQQAGERAPEDEAIKPSFSNMVEQALGSAVAAENKSESVQLQSLTGHVDLSELVTAVANAELSLNTVVAVRDRVINAYNDIIKMAI
jgi:flagellar hook-basal body complex protein FliE